MRKLALASMVGLSLLMARPSVAFEVLGHEWPNGEATFHVNIAGANGLWNSTFEDAMATWNGATPFTFFIVRDSFSDPCDAADARNGVAFTFNECGVAWGSTTLAVTFTSTNSNGDATESDIAFNIHESWNVYSAPYGETPWVGINDFRRVALHELGHAAGLGHENDVPALMRSFQAVGNTINNPTADDIAGVEFLYAPPPTSGPAPWLGLLLGD